MTPPLFLVQQVTLGEQDLDGDEGHHAAAVRRVRPGERIDVGDGRGALGVAEVVRVERGRVRIAVSDVVRTSRSTPRITVAQGLLKGDRADHAVAMLTEAGADTVVPWAAERCVVSWGAERAARGLARWRATAREAAKQSHRAWLPDVVDPAGTNQLCERVATAKATVILHESAGKEPGRLLRMLAGVGGLECRDDQVGPEAAEEVEPARPPEVVLVVGPEGGITDAEVARLCAAGGVAVRLGPNVLRADTAGVVGLALLSAWLGRW
jgi:16S rRNA (uracil1498-N3)-methyltransferase